MNITKEIKRLSNLLRLSNSDKEDELDVGKRDPYQELVCKIKTMNDDDFKTIYDKM